MMPASSDGECPTRAELLAENAKLRLEIDHRVRNSLQVVASLVDYTARSSREPVALAVLKILRARLSAMITVYQTLDDAPHRATVDMDGALRDLAGQVADSGVTGKAHPEIVVQASGVVLPLDDAMPVALMVVEVLLASPIGTEYNGRRPIAKVALSRDQDQATLRIDLQHSERQTVLLGLPDPTRQMINALARQLGGPFTIDNQVDGVTWRVEIQFPVRPILGRFPFMG